MDDIENLNTDNPNEFWNHVNKLGPKRNKDVPMEVYDNDGSIIYDTDAVLDRWKTDFEGLYNIPEGVHSFDNAFFQHAIHSKLQLEREFENDNVFLNRDISIEEVYRVVNNAKNKKAVGLDNLPYEVFKNELSVALIHKLFKFIFRLGIMPSIWGKAIIKPIPKNAQNDPHVPLNFRVLVYFPLLVNCFPVF